MDDVNSDFLEAPELSPLEKEESATLDSDIDAVVLFAGVDVTDIEAVMKAKSEWEALFE